MPTSLMSAGFAKRSWLLLLLLTGGLAPQLWSQNAAAGRTLSVEVRDATDGSPVIAAFVFVRNSSLGTSTDGDGRATLEIGDLRDVELVVTHLNYEKLTLALTDFGPGLNRILLQPAAFDFAAVEVAAKRSSPRKRRNWLRRFTTALVGETTRRNQVELLNPDVLWFTEEKGKLTAYARDYLQFANAGTGYRMRFYLDTFQLDRNEDVYYAGKLFFEDVSPRENARRQRRYERRRADYYLDSKAYFFTTLLRDRQPDPEHFSFGVTTQASPQAPARFQPLVYDDLRIRSGLVVDTLFLDDLLTVVHQGGQAIFIDRGQNGAAGVRENPLVSFLYSRTGRFIVDRAGRLLNAYEIEESGYWTRNRLATALPLDYGDTGPVPASAPSRWVLDALAAYPRTHPQEKVYLHCNQPRFSNRDRLWFRAYLVDAGDHRPVTPSQVVHVELIDPAGTIIKHWTLHRDRGLYGDWQWTAGYAPGNYRLRAYTQLMRNYDAGFFFERVIPVFDALAPTGLVGSRPESSEEQDTSELLEVSRGAGSSIAIDFFPEGGDLIEGLTTTVAFRLRDSLGRPVDTTGQIVDGTGQPIARLQPSYRGIGIFSLLPQPGARYYAELAGTDDPVRVPLPVARPSGLSLTANAISAQAVFLAVSASDTTQLAGAFLVGHVRGQLCFYRDNLTGGGNFKLLRADLPAGLLHFTLFDEQGRPRAERLVYNAGPAAPGLTLSDPVTTDSTVRLTLQLDSSLLATPVELSVAVTNPRLVPAPDDAPSLRSYLLLQSDLPEPLALTPELLADDNAARYRLDLLLMTQGWRRFRWPDLAPGAARDSLAFAPQRGYTITGYTTVQDKEERVPADVLLSPLTNPLDYHLLRTDAAGRFAFPDLAAFDTTQYILQARVANDRNRADNFSGQLQGDREVDIQLAAYAPPPVRPLAAERDTLLPLPTTQRTAYREKARQDDRNDDGLWQIDLETVGVTARRPDRYTTNRNIQGRLYSLDAMDWLNPTTRGTNLLAQVAPAFNFYPGMNNKLWVRGFDPSGVPKNLPVRISIDGGAPTDDPTRFLLLSADDIADIYISPSRNFIAVRTRNISRSRARYLNSGVLQFDHPGYTPAREFAPVRYAPGPNGQELRTTYYWNPDVTFDAAGKAQLRFPAPAAATGYHVRVEGVSVGGRVLGLDGGGE
jgi:hypothetical protein